MKCVETSFFTDITIAVQILDQIQMVVFQVSIDQANFYWIWRIKSLKSSMIWSMKIKIACWNF